MNGIYRTIAGRIRVDLQELARVVTKNRSHDPVRSASHGYALDLFD